MAADVNENFAKLKEWLEMKVGPANTAAITATGTLNGVQGTTSFFETGYLGGCQVLSNFRDATATNVLIDANIFLDSNCTQLATTAQGRLPQVLCQEHTQGGRRWGRLLRRLSYTNGLVQALRIR
jgi:hypothetical protein